MRHHEPTDPSLAPRDGASTGGPTRTRAAERTRRLVAGSIARAVAQGVTILRGIISVPLLLHYLGQERYGLWLTVAGVFTLLLFADLGLGGGLTTLLSKMTGGNNRAAERQLVSSVFFALSGLAVVFVVLDIALLRTLPWHQLFNVDYAGAELDAATISTFMLAMFAVSLPLTLASRVYIAYQEAYWASVWSMVGTVAGLAALIAVIWQEAGLGWLILAFFGVPQLVNVLACLVLFVYHKPWLCPSRRKVRLGQLRAVLGLGVAFTALELLKVVYNHSDNLIISYRSGVQEVVPYAVPFRMFLLATTAFQAAVIPIWGSIGEAKGSNDWNWIRSALKRLLTITVGGFGSACVLLALLAPMIVRIWTGGVVEVGHGFAFLLAALAVSNAISNSLQICLHGLGLIKQQLPFVIASVAIKLSLAWVLVPMVGVAGAAIASLVAVNLANVPGFAYLMRTELKRWRTPC